MKHSMYRWCESVTPRRHWPLIAAITLLASGAAFGQSQSEALCGLIQNSFGPFDYRTERNANLQMVESHHFTRQVETLVKGQEGYLGGDLDYTLRAFPNHHRALMSVIQWAERTKLTQLPNMRYSVECWFDRAVRFSPDDTTARMLYATYLMKISRVQDAGAQLERVASMAPDNPFTQYNVGLIYLDAHNYERALRQAHVAYALGFPRSDLKDKLVAAGKWQEAPPESAEKAPAASPPDAAASGSGG